MNLKETFIEFQTLHIFEKQKLDDFIEELLNLILLKFKIKVEMTVNTTEKVFQVNNIINLLHMFQESNN